MRVVVLGAGFGGLEVATRVSEVLEEDADVVLIDRAEGFVFGFSKLDVMFGRTTANRVLHPYRAIAKPGVRFVQANISAIDPQLRRVETDAGPFDADVLVVALGADLDPAATPGLTEAGHEFYTTRGAFAARDVLARFEGGHVVVGVTSTPFKCPPAPSETALMVHDLLTRKGLRQRSEVSLVMPLGAPIPPSPPASEALLGAFEERGIGWFPNSVVREVDPATRAVRMADGSDMRFDLFLAVPAHRVPRVVAEAGMVVDGWVPVDPSTLETSFADVYAVGDVTSVGTPKAGVFAEGQGAVVAEAIVARHSGRRSDATYSGRGQCYLEFGGDRVARVDVTFLPGQPPAGTFDDASAALAAEKAEFGSSRVRRWFGRDWATH